MSIKLTDIKVVKPDYSKGGMSVPYDYALAYPPSFSANDKQIPEIKDWKVGEEYIIVIKVKMRSMSSYDDGKKESTNAAFDVVAYETPEDTEYAEMSDDDIQKLQDKVQGGQA